MSTTVMNKKQTTMKKVLFGSAFGNMVEWFDYASYGYLATIIASVFFASGDSNIALLSVYAIFALSFIIRPIGGLIWGYYGDRIGRRKVLILTMCLMSVSTFCIGLLPSYEKIGILSPIFLLLFRMVQGFSASGEYAGAALMIAEHAPKKQRGLLVSFVPASTAAGMLLGAGVAALLEYNLSHELLVAWGWRIPFLMSLPLGLIGLLVRLKLEDAEEFTEMVQKQEKQQTPQLGIIEGIRKNAKQIFIAFGVICLNAVGFYIILSYMPTYLSTVLNYSSLQGTLTTIFTLLAYVVMLPIVGSLADRVGRKPMLVIACILFILFSYPIFLMMSSGGILAIVSMILLGAILACNDGVLATFLSELFPANIRYSAFGLSFNVGNALFGGTAPYVATFLIVSTGNQFSPAFYLMFAAVIALIALSKLSSASSAKQVSSTHSLNNA